MSSRGQFAEPSSTLSAQNSTLRPISKDSLRRYTWIQPRQCSTGWATCMPMPRCVPVCPTLQTSLRDKWIAHSPDRKASWIASLLDRALLVAWRPGSRPNWRFSKHRSYCRRSRLLGSASRVRRRVFLPLRSAYWTFRS